jgi:hypothetical protein
MAMARTNWILIDTFMTLKKRGKEIWAGCE